MPARIEPFYAELGRRLHGLRTSKGLTQEALGARLHMTRASIANIETGKQRLLAKTLVDLADALDTDVTELLPARPPTSKQESTSKLRDELAAHLNDPTLELLLAKINVPTGTER